jgi:hypothetical protein
MWLLLLFFYLNTVVNAHGEIGEINTHKKSVPLYFCTAANNDYFEHVLNLIGSIYCVHYQELEEIALFDLGLTPEQKTYLNTIDKLKLYEIERVHVDIIKKFKTGWGNREVPGWYAWKPVVIKQALNMFPYVLWLDAGTTIKQSVTNLFKVIINNGYFLATIGDENNGIITHSVGWGMTRFVADKFNMQASDRVGILSKEPVMGGIIGARADDQNNFIHDLYKLAHDLRNYQDDGTAPHGFGTARHDQTLMSILAYTRNILVHKQDFKQINPIYLNVDGNNEPFYITWHADYVDARTHIYSSRNDLRNIAYYRDFIRFKKTN